MNFINAEVDILSLPQVSEISFKPIHTSYLKIVRIEWLITTCVLLLIAGVLIFFVNALQYSFNWVWLCGATLFISLFYLFLIEKGFPQKAFVVREKDIAYRYGWLTHHIKVCPFNRIQNCSLLTGPLERRYGLSTLVIFTAGSDGADMRIPGLLQEEAEKIRRYILEKIHKEEHENI